MPFPVMPFGMCCVASAVENAGHKSKVLDLCFSKNCKRDIKKAIKQFQPDVIGISVRNIDSAAPYKIHFFLDFIKDEIIAPVKEVFSGTIILGGSAVGISGAEMLSFFDLQFAIRGDGEVAMVQFLDRLEKKLPLNNLGGLILRKGDEIIAENPPQRTSNLDALDLARYYRHVDLELYRKYKSPIQMQTKRGCAEHCTYCTYNTIEGRKVRLRDPQKIADDIESIVKETGINHIEFTDSAFNIPLDHSKAVLRAIISKKLDLKLQTMGLNPGSIDEEYADLLKEANFIDVDISIESGCDATLKTLGKSFTKADIIRTSNILHRKKIPIMWYLLTGAPGETKETLIETFNTIQQVAGKWDLINVGNGIRLYKGAPLSKRLQQKKPECTQDNFFRPLAFEPESISLEELRKLNKQIASKNPNIMFYDDFQNVPFFVIKMQVLIMKLLAPKKPWWKFFIFYSNAQKYLGINFVKQLFSSKPNVSRNFKMSDKLRRYEIFCSRMS
jgi:hypothetical protein